MSNIMKKRTECYVCNPNDLELYCPNNNVHKITWSEWEEHIWCFECEKDIKYERGGAGPIPKEVSKLLGIDYRKYNIKTGEIIEGSGL